MSQDSFFGSSKTFVRDDVSSHGNITHPRAANALARATRVLRHLGPTNLLLRFLALDLFESIFRSSYAGSGSGIKKSSKLCSNRATLFSKSIAIGFGRLGFAVHDVNFNVAFGNII